MNTKIIRTLVKKEMLDVFRDKKTMVMMVLVPVILYPLIFVGAMQFMSFISSSMETQNYRISVDAKDGDAFIHKLTEQPAGEERSRKETETITIIDAAAVPDYETALNEESIDGLEVQGVVLFRSEPVGFAFHKNFSYLFLLFYSIGEQ